MGSVPRPSLVPVTHKSVNVLSSYCPSEIIIVNYTSPRINTFWLEDSLDDLNSNNRFFAKNL